MRSTKTPLKTIDPQTPDADLIALVAQGQEPALNELMRRYKQKLHAFVLRYMNDSDSAYDILQETFIRVYFKADSFQAGYSFSTWLYQIALNLCRDRARKSRGRQWLSLDFGNTDWQESLIAESGYYSQDSVERDYQGKQELVVVAAAIHSLPDKLKTALILFAVEDNSYQRCAELLNIPPKAVELRVYRARKLLLSRLPQSS